MVQQPAHETTIFSAGGMNYKLDFCRTCCCIYYCIKEIMRGILQSTC